MKLYIILDGDRYPLEEAFYTVEQANEAIGKYVDENYPAAVTEGEGREDLISEFTVKEIFLNVQNNS